MSTTVNATILGFPRIGANRELKRLVEGFWAGAVSLEALLSGTASLRSDSWTMQKSLGLDRVPCNDFSLYDQVLDAACLVGAVPARYSSLLKPGKPVPIEAYFAMARGIQNKSSNGESGADLPAMEMKKFFDTNYHYIVPELDGDTAFSVSSTKPFDEFAETQALAITSRVVLMGPVTFLMLSKPSANASKGFVTISLLDQLIPVYVQIVEKLVNQGATHIQFDEPFACMDPTENVSKSVLIDAYTRTYDAISAAAGSRSTITLATYFQSPHPDLIQTIASLPVQCIHIDATRSSQELLQQSIQAIAQAGCGISLGIVDGRNIWKVNAAEKLAFFTSPANAVLKGLNVTISSSCSLLHSPWTIENEERLDDTVKDWMAFAKEKIVEVVNMAKLVSASFSGVRASAEAVGWFEANKASINARKTSIKTCDPNVRQRIAQVDGSMFSRTNDFSIRRQKQQEKLQLPMFPTTTIGSFPQTKEVRKARAQYKLGHITEHQYMEYITEATKECIKFQEQVGLDVLVHGEFERTDMVEFFGEHLNGMLFTANGWVQSYGSRCVKPPVIYGDVQRTKPMTVDMATLAQSMSTKPVKGMLTGPVTILQWSFVRDDQPRKDTCQQIGLAIRDEVNDLQNAGIAVIQVDEPAIREGLPMRKSEQAEYLKWSVDSFLLSTCVARDDTQIHSHMCYSDFVDILHAIARMDCDVLSIESSRSDLKLLAAFTGKAYPMQLGPGLYDIHSPRVPSVKEMVHRAKKIVQYLSPDQLWVNPDCGLKTRGWKETNESVTNLIKVAKLLREEYAN